MIEPETKQSVAYRLLADLEVKKDLNGVRLAWKEVEIEFTDGKAVVKGTSSRNESLLSAHR
jgi:hypothetical protein